MKYLLIMALSAGFLAAAPAHAGSIYSSIEDEGEDYGDIYSTRGNRDIYTTEDKRNGLYTSKDDGSIYSSEDKREGAYTTGEKTPDPGGVDNVQGSDLKDGGAIGPGDVYNGYMPGD